tara:strand:- start:6 stop:428 length:423 start_codon:yes stop_codon:yes gene_type:complete
MKYEDYHQEPINKIIHTICIPIIVVSTISLVSIIKHKFKFSDRNGLISTFMALYYFYKYSFFVSIVMFFYYTFAVTISDVWLDNTNYNFYKTIKVFIMAWILQFIGHYIEGSSPALFDGIASAFTEAPLYSLNNIFRILD